MARKTMKTLPAPMKKLADAELGSVAGASGSFFDFSPISVANYSSNVGTQVSMFNGNGSGPYSGNTSQTQTQSNSTTNVILHG